MVYLNQNPIQEEKDMKKIKKAFSLLLALVMVFSMAVSVCARDFSDLENHWAKSYMEDLNDRGFLSGYTDGTMKPDNSISTCESLVLLSRFYGLNDSEMKYVDEDFGAAVKAALPNNLQWAADELSLCRAANIITDSELKTLNFQNKIEKQLFSVFPIRAIGLEDEAKALTGASLNFTDKASINPSYLGHIQKLLDIGVIQGDTTNQFTPKATMTRAMAATMVSRGLDWLEKEDSDLSVDGYDGLARLEGILSYVGSSTVQIRGFDGMLREYKLSDSYEAKVNGVKKTLSTDHIGCYAKLSSLNGVINELSLTDSEDTYYIAGRISSVSTSTSGTTVKIYDLSDGDSVSFKITDESAALTLDGSKAAISDLRKGQFIVVKVENKALASMDAVSGNYELSCSFSSVSYGTTTLIRVIDQSGTVCVYPVSITDLPKVKRGEETISLDRLNSGDSIKLTAEDCELYSIASLVPQKNASGTLDTIKINSNGTWWTIKEDGGSSVTYEVDSYAAAHKGTKSIAISSIAVGDSVSVTIYGKTITAIELQSAASSSDKLTATVLDVSGSTITAVKDNKLVYISTSGATVFDTSTGKTIKVTALDVNTLITVYGSYSSGQNFKATSIVVE